MNAPFEPVGELARWRVLVELFRAVERGTTIVYAELGKALDLHPKRDRKAICAAVGQAGRTLSREHERSVVAVRNVGYRVVLPDEQIDLAARHQRKAGRSVVRARMPVDHVDMSAMSEATRNAFHAAARVLAYQEGQIRRLDLRQKDLESALDSVVTTVDRTAAEQAEQAERIAALERKLAERGDA